MSKYEKFSVTKEVQKEIEEKLKELHKICQYQKVPMFASVVIANDKEGTEYNNIIYNPLSHGINLKDDKIKKYMLVADGFDVVPPRDILTIKPDELLNEGDLYE